MSNIYVSNLLLADPSTTVAGKDIDYQTPQRIANGVNYSIGAGACHNVLSQSFSDKCFIQDSGFYTEMAEWRIPLVSRDHETLDFIIHYDILGSSTACKVKFTLDVGGTSASIEIALPSTAEIANDSLTISIPNADLYYGTLTMYAKGDTSNNAECIIKSVMARWAPISSPIPGGRKSQYDLGDILTPMGTSRTGINQAFTSRFAHNVIDNVSILRKRMRSYLNWSGVYSASSSSLGISDAGCPEVFIGIGHTSLVGGYPLAPSGYDSLDGRKLELHVRSIGDSTVTKFDFFGNTITLSNAVGVVGWSVHTIELNYSRVSTRGDINLPYYDARLDNSTLNQTLGLFARYGYVPDKYPTVNSTNYGSILSLNLMGI